MDGDFGVFPDVCSDLIRHNIIFVEKPEELMVGLERAFLARMAVALPSKVRQEYFKIAPVDSGAETIKRGSKSNIREVHPFGNRIAK